MVQPEARAGTLRGADRTGIGRIAGTMLIVGHRGSSHRYPENTMLAFERAVKEGAHGIETDVRKTADGVHVLIHDARVDRTTNGTGAVSTLTWDEIAALDAGAWKGRGFANREDTRVPRLDAFLDYYRGEPVFLFLQMKLGLTDALAVVDMVTHRDMQDQCFIFTDRSRLAGIKAHVPDVMVVNDGMNHDPWDLLAQARAEGWDAISPGWTHVTPKLVEEANAAGMYVMASFVSGDYEANTRALIKSGCNMILGNDCASMVSVADRHGVRQVVPPLAVLRKT